jgi:hypothetical protein
MRIIEVIMEVFLLQFFSIVVSFLFLFGKRGTSIRFDGAIVIVMVILSLILLGT